MNDKMEGGWAVGRAIWTSLVLAFLFLFVSGANAAVIDVHPGESITDAIASAGFGDTVLVHPGTYDEQILVSQGVILRGIDKPMLTNDSPGAEVINVTGDGLFSVITGFNITGGSTGVHVQGPDAVNVSLVYNNIYRNNLGLNASDFGTCLPNEPYTLDFWGENGTGPFKGMPGAASESAISKASVKVGTKVNSKVNSKVNTKVNAKANAKASSKVNSVVHRNNGIAGSADASSWLTGGVINGNAINTAFTGACDNLVLLNPEAGVDVSIDGAIGDSCVVGAAAYLDNVSPYGPIPPGLGVAIRYVDVVVKGDNVDQARVSINYTDEEVADAGAFEDTLTPYLWTGTTWRSPIDGTLTRDPINKVVSGNFSTLSLSGQPIALIGKSYKVTILPHADPSKPISINPLLNITIESGDNITGVYYQVDGFAGSGWKPIEVPFDGQIWNNPAWSINDSDWANLTNGSHTFYFRFTRASTSDVGGNGEISWRFTKGGNVPPVSPIVVTSPKTGDTLTRTPWKITWTMPTPENVLSVDLWFARDGDFTMRGGLNNPLHLATLGADTSYLWMSPNFQTDTAKIAAVVTYNDGTQYVGFSENFSLAKGYSFHAYKPTPKTPWQIGTGISRAIAVLGSWFHKPHIPYIIR
jgi:hypothetical protein